MSIFGVPSPFRFAGQWMKWMIEDNNKAVIDKY